MQADILGHMDAAGAGLLRRFSLDLGLEYQL